MYPSSSILSAGNFYYGSENFPPLMLEPRIRPCHQGLIYAFPPVTWTQNTVSSNLLLHYLLKKENFSDHCDQFSINHA